MTDLPHILFKGEVENAAKHFVNEILYSGHFVGFNQAEIQAVYDDVRHRLVGSGPGAKLFDNAALPLLKKAGYPVAGA